MRTSFASIAKSALTLVTANTPGRSRHRLYRGSTPTRRVVWLMMR